MFDVILMRVIDDLIKAGNSEFEAITLVLDLLSELMDEDELKAKLMDLSGNDYLS